MGVLMTAMPRSVAAELFDSPRLPAGELSESLRDLECLNRWFGGTRAVISALGPLIARWAVRERVTVLDAGAGGADIPRAIVRWARRRKIRIEITACDVHRQILALAVKSCRDFPEIRFVHGDVLELPFAPGSFDLAICTLTAHHLNTDEVTRLFRKLDETARCGVVISDLVRSRAAHAGVWLATHLLSRNRLIRHDGPLSVRRAYTACELNVLARAAGLGGLRFVRRPLFRLVGVLQKWV
jgi:SAM-dependent methyltransferase